MGMYHAMPCPQANAAGCGGKTTWVFACVEGSGVSEDGVSSRAKRDRWGDGEGRKIVVLKRVKR